MSLPGVWLVEEAVLGFSLEEALGQLRRDPVMEGLVKRYDPPLFRETGDVFFDLVRSVVSQQLSAKAAETIFGRIEDLFESEGAELSPQGVLTVPEWKIRKCGVSFNKMKYMRNLAEAAVNGRVEIDRLSELSDEQVLGLLTQIKGIGRWTAEMILIFSLNRPDVFSVGDLGLRTAVSRLYYVDREDREKIEEMALRWRPYRSVASRYLWKSLENK